jgi:hypothetical protein
VEETTFSCTAREEEKRCDDFVEGARQKPEKPSEIVSVLDHRAVASRLPFLLRNPI